MGEYLIPDKKYCLTIGIPTKNRKDKIKKCLIALQNQRFKHFCIIVVDGSDGDETQKVCSEFSKSMDLLYIKQLRPGVSYARSVIASLCQTEALLYVDDDLYLFNNAILNLLNYYNNFKSRDIRVISGTIKYYGDFTSPIKLDSQGKGFKSSASEADYFLGALMLIPSAVYKNVFWARQFTTWGFEEVLFFLMCKRHGVKFSWYAELLGVHDDETMKTTRANIGTEANRAYTMLYKHFFSEPSIVGLLKLESLGFLRYLVVNLFQYVFSPKCFFSYISSYIYSWFKGHLMFLEDIKCLKK
ncbi:MAG: glycosyltransferase family 2 protein [Candidatus Bathyarchaeota archaeon]|nr:MAG: glycosyltransferase family 2 protein [Candidatus Bathyarchaeota archaeon]